MITSEIYGGLQTQQPQFNPLAQLAQLEQVRALQAQGQDRIAAGEQRNKLLSLVQAPDFAALPAAQKAQRLQGVGAFDEAGKVITSDAAANKDSRAAEASGFDLKVKQLDAAANIAGTVRDQASYERALPLMQQLGFDTSKFSPQYNPEGVAQFAQATLSAKDRLTAEQQARSQAITMRGQDLSRDTALQGQQLTSRGQDMTDARAREFNATKVEENKIKRDEKQDTANMTKAGQIASFDTMLGTLDRLGKHPGLSRSVGVTGMLPTIPGSDSANFQAELDTFQSQAFVPMVAQLKGMGALSDAEGRKLTQAVGALNPRMGEKAFRESVQRITQDMEAARTRVAGKSGSGGASGSFGTPQAQAGMSAPKSKAEFDALPSGALFTAPDGTTRRKP